jgi:hypothetical protein
MFSIHTDLIKDSLNVIQLLALSLPLTDSAKKSIDLELLRSEIDSGYIHRLRGLFSASSLPETVLQRVSFPLLLLRLRLQGKMDSSTQYT